MVFYMKFVAFTRLLGKGQKGSLSFQTFSRVSHWYSCGGTGKWLWSYIRRHANILFNKFQLFVLPMLIELLSK